ncbi:beta-glucosidase 12-like isoform X2 [Macadamia integrifolia]|uniref:beta-glucosidase 12-like isoform X2 n=1 Tax=Macadamia integrifolia TaxID=60698 RepID=UPI001C52AECF|nr:beta-glucosidase 12-like isoform X2 [Macadamia integrifolia]
MAVQDSLVMVLGFIVFVNLYVQAAAGVFGSNVTFQLSRINFPEGFIFGTASAAYQYEGAAFVDGKGPSTWDFFTHRYPGKITDQSNGDVAVDSYHRYKEDVSIMKQMGMDAYRFSISWARLLPEGKLSGGVNEDGIRYYNDLINELLSNGIQPFVTIFHWDCPLALDKEYGGFLSPRIIKDFQDFADLCFREFGDRVKHWMTFNEAYLYSNYGYATGSFAPGRCSKWVSSSCIPGNSGSEPYKVAHHQLLSHAAAVKLYRKKYQSQKGKIGMALVANWMVPFSRSKSNIAATNRGLDFKIGWFMNPLTYGDYPDSMRALVGDRLPKFSKKQSLMVKGSLDFIGLNYYTANYAAEVNLRSSGNLSSTTDSQVNLTSSRNGTFIGEATGHAAFYVYPRGIRDVMIYIKKNYRNPVIFITENGFGELNNSSVSLEESLKDDKRVDFYHRHLHYLRRAIEDGVDVRGYFAWSLLDNFEWSSGYTVRFGINHVDYKDRLKRYPKHSAIWFKNFLNNYIVF